MSEQLPMVSVVLPVRNEAAAIGACLDAVLAQDYAKERFEILVADGQSDDGCPAVVREYARRDPRVRLLDNPGRIVPTGMNVAIRAARGEVIARVDGHTLIERDYLRTGVEALRRTGAENVGGLIRPVGGGVFADAVAGVMCSRLGIGATFHFAETEQDADTVYMGMWPRAAFARFGLFDEELVRNQDDELNYRIRKNGGRVRLVPEMRSSYKNRGTPRRLARQFYEYGLWKVRVLQKHPPQMSQRHFVPPAFVVWVVATLLLVPFVSMAGPALAIGAGLYLLVILAVAARGSRGDPRRWLAAAAAFVIIHLSWGSGFLVGLLRFARLWWRPEQSPPRLDDEAAGDPAMQRKEDSLCT